MNVLLLSMPDAFEHMPPIAIRMPNGALASLAGNVDAHHRVAVADLILVQDRVRLTVERLRAHLGPDVGGLPVMTLQRRTALRIIDLVPRLLPTARRHLSRHQPGLARVHVPRQPPPEQREAGPELPRLSNRARAGRHPGRTSPRGARHLPR